MLLLMKRLIKVGLKENLLKYNHNSKICDLGEFHPMKI